MKFAIINEVDGSIRQINEAMGNTETLAEINARLPEGQQAIECGPEVTLEHVYNSQGQFDMPIVEPPA